MRQFKQRPPYPVALPQNIHFVPIPVVHSIVNNFPPQFQLAQPPIMTHPALQQQMIKKQCEQQMMQLQQMLEKYTLIYLHKYTEQQEMRQRDLQDQFQQILERQNEQQQLQMQLEIRRIHHELQRLDGMQLQMRQQVEKTVKPSLKYKLSKPEMIPDPQESYFSYVPEKMEIELDKKSLGSAFEECRNHVVPINLTVTFGKNPPLKDTINIPINLKNSEVDPETMFGSGKGKPFTPEKDKQMEQVGSSPARKVLNDETRAGAKERKMAERGKRLKEYKEQESLADTSSRNGTSREQHFSEIRPNAIPDTGRRQMNRGVMVGQHPSYPSNNMPRDRGTHLDNRDCYGNENVARSSNRKPAQTKSLVTEKNWTEESRPMASGGTTYQGKCKVRHTITQTNVRSEEPVEIYDHSSPEKTDTSTLGEDDMGFTRDAVPNAPKVVRQTSDVAAIPTYEETKKKLGIIYKLY